MAFPHSCPVCRSESLRRVLRGATFLAKLGAEVSPLNGVASYQCEQGHVFLIVESETVRTQKTGTAVRRAVLVG